MPGNISNEIKRLLPVVLVVHPLEINPVLEHAHGHDGEGEHGRSGLEMSAERLVGIREGDMGMDTSVNHVAVHAGDVGRAGGILHKDVFGGKSAVTHRMVMITFYRANA